MIKQKRNILLLALLLALLLPQTIMSQRYIYAHQDGEEYFTLELDTDNTITWGAFRALNHHSIPYFDMTLLVQRRTTNQGDSILIAVPTYYSYSYRHELFGVADTINARLQNLKLFFQVKNNGKELTFYEPDSIKKQELISYSSFTKKDEIDILSIPSSFVLTKNPKWVLFPNGLRRNIKDRAKLQIREFIPKGSNK